jgi:ketosteroid isomerase-like protein
MMRFAMTLAVCLLTLAPVAAQSGEEQKILAWLKGYDAAFLSKDLNRIAAFYHPDVTIYEGAGVNTGWADYRDHHLGPELKAFENLEFGHTNYVVHMLGDRAAYVTSEYFIKAKFNERMLDSIGRETLILEKQADGSWKIRHSHTGSRARPAPKPAGAHD